MALLTLKDGRNLEYFENGVDSDRAILLLHGTPSDGSAYRRWFKEIKEVRAIATSRPGYGKSDRHKGRSVADDLSDQVEVLNHFGVKKFVVIGWSGGGPHSLNMSREPRCAAAITIAGVGEYGHEDLDFLADMGPENIDEFGEAIKGEAAITEWMNKNANEFKKVTGSQLIEAFGGLIGEADKRCLTPELADESAETMRSALAHSCDGWIDDDLAFVQKFGFDLAKIDKPVLLYQGNDDFMVPHKHAYWLEKQIPGSKLNFVPGHGHISLGEEYRPTIIQEALGYLAG